MFFLSSSLLVSILSSQADPPTLKNLDFAVAGARFSKNQGIRYKDAFDGVLALSWVRFSCSCGLFCCFGGLSMALRVFKICSLRAPELPSWLPRGPQQPPTTRQAHPWRGRWPLKATEAHLETYFDLFPFDFDAQIDEKGQKEPSSKLF